MILAFAPDVCPIITSSASGVPDATDNIALGGRGVVPPIPSKIPLTAKVSATPKEMSLLS